MINILKKYIPVGDITEIIQCYNMPSKKDIMRLKNKTIISFKEEKKEFDDAKPLLNLYWNNYISKFETFLYFKHNQDYHLNNIMRVIGKRRAENLLKGNVMKKYQNEITIINHFLEQMRYKTLPATYHLLNLFRKVSKLFKNYIADDLCYYAISKTKSKYHICNNKRTIENNKKSIFCKRHINADQRKNKLLIKTNINKIENYEIQIKHKLYITNYEKDYNEINICNSIK